MKTVYFRELESYPKLDIRKLLGKEIFEKLLESNHIVVDNKNCKFDFVGVILLNEHVLRCYPKYMDYIPPTEFNELEDDLKESREDLEDIIGEDFEDVMRAIKKYKKQYEPFQYENEELEKIPFNLLSLMLFFIEDYYENGIYSNIQNILEVNGDGEINWDKTINDSFALIKNRRPYYTELYTRHKIDDSFNYFRLLHECIITECSKCLEKAGLLEIFDLTPVELSDLDLDDFDDKWFIKNKIEKELNLEFNTHKQKLLKSMQAYVCKEKSFSNKNFLTLYGANAYEKVWEKMCAKVFNNKLEINISDLNLEIDSEFKYDSDDRLIDIIERPNWGSNKGYCNNKKETLEPDIITFFEKNFIIFDAKYYNLTFNKNQLAGQPGIGDITKQYLYQLAYKDFIKYANFEGVKNAFLMPTSDSKVKNIGCVELKMLHDLYLENTKIPLENIQVILLPAKEITKKYLKNGVMDISRLELENPCPKCPHYDNK